MSRERVKPESRSRKKTGMHVSIDDFIDEYEERLKFSMEALEEALEEQSDLFNDVSQRLALETSKRDGAKTDIVETEAMVDLEIRGDAAAEGRKITEKEVDATKNVDNRVLESRKIYHKHSENVRRLEALKESFQQRSYALKELANLWVAGYYGDTSIKEGVSQVRESTAEKARRAQSEKRHSRHSNRHEA